MMNQNLKEVVDALRASEPTPGWVDGVALDDQVNVDALHMLLEEQHSRHCLSGSDNKCDKETCVCHWSSETVVDRQVKEVFKDAVGYIGAVWYLQTLQARLIGGLSSTAMRVQRLRAAQKDIGEIGVMLDRALHDAPPRELLQTRAPDGGSDSPVPEVPKDVEVISTDGEDPEEENADMGKAEKTEVVELVA